MSHAIFTIPCLSWRTCAECLHNASSDDLASAISRQSFHLGNYCQDLQNFACHIPRCLWSPCRIGQRCHAEGALKNLSKATVILYIYPGGGGGGSSCGMQDLAGCILLTATVDKPRPPALGTSRSSRSRQPRPAEDDAHGQLEV